MNVEHGITEAGSGLIEGFAGRVGMGDAAEQALQRTGTAEPLQITHQGEGTISLAPPAKAEAITQAHLYLHGLHLVESLQLPASTGLKAEAGEAGSQAVGIAQHRWQDGEMGHGGNARFF
jgi:hypothetical protein